MDLVKEKLLNPFTARWKSGPSAETGRFPQIVDVDWRLDVLVKVKHHRFIDNQYWMFFTGSGC
jgi:hypothetical protein